MWCRSVAIKAFGIVERSQTRFGVGGAKRINGVPSGNFGIGFVPSEALEEKVEAFRIHSLCGKLQIFERSTFADIVFWMQFNEAFERERCFGRIGFFFQTKR